MGRDLMRRIDQHVGSRLLMQRLKKGLSQQAIGAELGVSFQQVQKYERGQNRISASTLAVLSCCLGVEPNFFFADLPADLPKVPMTAEALSGPDLTVLTAFHKLSSQQQQLYLQLMQEKPR